MDAQTQTPRLYGHLEPTDVEIDEVTIGASLLMDTSSTTESKRM